MMQLSDAQLAAALVELRSGNVIGLPTETVYGLAADGTNPAAVRKIFSIKGRPVDHPLILHLGDVAWLDRFTVGAPQAANLLADAFWPGPLSLVLKRSDSVPDEVTGGLATVAVRVPSHPIALQVLRALDRPLAAPSANRFGEVSPTTRAHVERDLGAEVPLVLEGGACDVGVESTIVDLSGDHLRILRPGGVSGEAIESVLRRQVSDDDGSGPAAPGTLDAHYAPRAEVVLVSEREVEREVRRALDANRKVGVFASPSFISQALPSVVFRAQGDAKTTAHDLYSVLRELDDAGCDLILTTVPEGGGIAHAVSDRLKRAAHGTKRVSGTPEEPGRAAPKKSER